MNEFELPINTQLNPEFSLEMVGLHHVPGLFEHTVRHREILSQWLPWVKDIVQLEDTYKFIKTVAIEQAHEKTAWHFAITYQKQGVGMISYHPIEWMHRKTNLGYWISPEYEGRGLVTQASSLLTDWGFSKLFLNRIGIQCGSGNKKSQRIAEKLNMKLEGIERDAEWLYDHFIDHHLYAVLKSDWLAK